MTSAPDASLTPKPRASWREGWAVYLQRRVLIVLLLGFSSGLPLALSGSTLLVWMRESGVDLGTSGLFVALGALLVAAMSSTQDIVVDAFRVESLPESEQAAGMASYVAAYRIGMLVSTAGALFLVSAFEGTGIARSSAWMWGYVVMAAMVLIGTVTALAATEPEQSARAEAATRTEAALTRVMHAAIGAFSE